MKEKQQSDYKAAEYLLETNCATDQNVEQL